MLTKVAGLNSSDRYRARIRSLGTLEQANVTRVVLASGREITLSRIEVKGIYGGMREGYPGAKVNDMMIPGARQQERCGGGPAPGTPRWPWCPGKDRSGYR